MSNAVKELRSIAIAYIGAVIDVTAVREHLRHLRKKRFRGSREAAAAADLGPSTIAKIENLKSWPKYDPGIGVILKLLQALDVTLTDFVTDLRNIDYAVVERSQNEVLNSSIGVGHDRLTPADPKVATDASASMATTSTIDARYIEDTVRKIVTDHLDHGVRAIVADILDHAKRAEPERKVATRARKKSKRRQPTRAVTRRGG